ncbi:uncharacterized protein LODBEIA_P35360 [Lodderomyces beijingensis]|uniref:Chloride channel protein n=1 Tax=Lodderomyces beijingensis TaxID=1775926 RepID=A0ABP0ZME7_9ASCO
MSVGSLEDDVSDTLVSTTTSQRSFKTNPKNTIHHQIRQLQRFSDFRTIDWVEDELDEQKQRLLKIKQIQSRSTNFKDKVLSQILNWLILATMGIIIGCIAGSLNIITSFLASIKKGHCRGAFYLNESFCCWGESGEGVCSRWIKWSQVEVLNYAMFIALSVVMSYVAAKLVKSYSPSAAGSGISEIKCIISGFVVEGFLGWWTLLIKCLGLPLAIGSGLSLGKEGPSVHYAVCVGNCVAKLVTKYRKSASKGREFLTATAAAGVAVAFGSPMGGVLFATEEMSSVFHLSTLWKSYFCSLVAVTTLAAINPFRTGQLVLFEVTYDTNWHYFEIPVYILLGVFGGVYGIIVSKYNIQVVAFRKKYLGNWAIREVFILTLFTACFSYFNQFLQVDMTESMQILFRECDSGFHHPLCDPDQRKAGLFVSLLFATVARMFLTIITYGCKVPAGIFVPSMAAGATFGRAIGILVDYIYRHHPDSFLFSACSENNDKCVIPGTYAFLGAAAGLCGITDLTVTVVIIMFELTGAVRYIIPTMIVVAITKSINDKWGNGGIADQMIQFNGLPLIDAKEDFSFGTTVVSAMSTAMVAFSSDATDSLTMGQLRKTMATTKFRGFPIVHSGSNPKVYGYISRYAIEYVLKRNEEINDVVVCNFSQQDSGSLDRVDFSNLVNRSPLTVKSDATLEFVLDIFVKLGPRYILIEQDSVLIGIITRKDVLRYEYSSHAHETPEVEVYEERNEKIWEFMNLITLSMRKNLGKLLHNDPSRYVQST